MYALDILFASVCLCTDFFKNLSFAMLVLKGEGGGICPV